MKLSNRKQDFIVRGLNAEILKRIKELQHLELVSEELNHLAAILHVNAGGLYDYYEVKKKLYFFKKKMEIP